MDQSIQSLFFTFSLLHFSERARPMLTLSMLAAACAPKAMLEMLYATMIQLMTDAEKRDPTRER